MDYLMTGHNYQNLGQFFSLKKADDPLKIETERAIEIILEKRQKDKEKIIKEYAEDNDIKVLKGRWGAYIAAYGKNYRIPKDIEAKELTLEGCQKIVAEAKDKPAKGKK